MVFSPTMDIFGVPSYSGSCQNKYYHSALVLFIHGSWKKKSVWGFKRLVKLFRDTVGVDGKKSVLEFVDFCLKTLF